MKWRRFLDRSCQLGDGRRGRSEGGREVELKMECEGAWYVALVLRGMQQGKGKGHVGSFEASKTI